MWLKCIAKWTENEN